MSNFKKVVDGTITTDKSEKIFFAASIAGTYFGFLNMSNMQAGDGITVRMKKQGGNVYEMTYVGVQNDPILYFTPQLSIDNIQISIAKIAGVDRLFQYTMYFIQDEKYHTLGG